MLIILFVLCSLASTVGSIVGAGGGIIIKPVIDLLNIIPVTTVSFLSSCEVLAMSCSSLLRSRGSGIKLDMRVSAPLAAGSAVGGMIGKLIFDTIKRSFGNDSLVGGIQSTVYALVLVFVFVYLMRKSKIRSLHVRRIAVSSLTGLALGIISSFLGIGGGPYIVATLFFLFSMDAKTAARNSIFIILLAQTSSLTYTFIWGNVPEFDVIYLIAMVVGGIAGGIFGSALTRRMSNKHVETLLIVLIAVMFMVAVANCFKFFGALNG